MSQHYYYKLNLKCIIIAGTGTSDLDAWELARQNRITQQILQNYLEKKLFPHLHRATRVPSVWEILPTGARRPKPTVQNNIQEVIKSLESNTTKESLQSVETEQVSSFSDSDEGMYCFIIHLFIHNRTYIKLTEYPV